jgi:hypothetical protein
MRQAHSKGLCHDCFNEKYGNRKGGDKMIHHHSSRRSNKFRRANFNTTHQISEKGSIISGRPDAIFIRNKYQTELDNSWSAIVNMIHHVETRNKELKDVFNNAQSLKQDIGVHESERAELYENLGNVLNKETNFEKDMWQKTMKGRKVKSLTIKQKFKDSDIDEMRYDSMMDYLKQYPEYTSKSTFKKILDKIDQKEAEIRDAKKSYNKSVSHYNSLLSAFEVYIQKCEDKFAVYHKFLKEGEEKLAKTRYRKSIFYKLATEKTKAETNLDTLTHRPEQFMNTLKILKREHSETKGKSFKEMEY